MQRLPVLLGLCLAVALPVTSQHCSSVSFSVPVTSKNVVFASPPDPTNATQVIDFTLASFRGTPPPTSGTVTISDTFTIAATYCVPVNQTKSALQILLHGITYDKSYWSAFDLSPPNNWHLAATGRGYATLAIDRLGHGDNPQRPDPLAVVQPQMNVEILHQLISIVRKNNNNNNNNNNNPLGRAYNKIIAVGHSYGSAVAFSNAKQNPLDADALVLTAFSSSINFTALFSADWIPLSHHRFPPSAASGNNNNNLLPFGYLTLASEAERTASFYYHIGAGAGDFPPILPPVDFAREDSLTDGEGGDIASLLLPVSGYDRPVFVATGAQDVLLCAAGGTAEECSAKLARTRLDFFPGLEESRYAFFAPDRTGHDIHLHASAGETFRRVHDFLDGML